MTCENYEHFYTAHNQNQRIFVSKFSIHLSVSPAWAEPVEGWVDSLNGPIGIMVGK